MFLQFLYEDDGEDFGRIKVLNLVKVSVTIDVVGFKQVYKTLRKDKGQCGWRNRLRK